MRVRGGRWGVGAARFMFACHKDVKHVDDMTRDFIIACGKKHTQKKKKNTKALHYYLRLLHRSIKDPALVITLINKCLGFKGSQMSFGSLITH